MSDRTATPDAGGIPHFLAPEGAGISINVRDHDGIIRFGEGATFFETHWDGEFRAYREGGTITGVAVTQLTSLEELASSDLALLNYTNRDRMNFIGGAIVFRRGDGSYLLVAQTGRHQEGNEVAIMTFDYRMVLAAGVAKTQAGGRVVDARGMTFFAGDGFLGDSTVNGAPLNAGTINGDVVEEFQPEVAGFDLYQPFTPRALPDAARAMRKRLSHLLEHSDEFVQERLSNNPPPAIILDQEARDEALSALDALSSVDAQSANAEQILKSAGTIIFRVAGQVLKWSGAKLDKVVDTALETATQEGIKVGLTSLLAMGAWNAVGADLMKLAVSAMQAFGG